jgi:hypothetical protein
VPISHFFLPLPLTGRQRVYRHEYFLLERAAAASLQLFRIRESSYAAEKRCISVETRASVQTAFTHCGFTASRSTVVSSISAKETREKKSCSGFRPAIGLVGLDEQLPRYAIDLVDSCNDRLVAVHPMFQTAESAARSPNASVSTFIRDANVRTSRRLVRSQSEMAALAIFSKVTLAFRRF